MLRRYMLRPARYNEQRKSRGIATSMERRRFNNQMAAAGGDWLVSASSEVVLQGGSVTCRVVDAKSGQTNPARVRLLDARATRWYPLGILHRWSKTLRKVTFGSSRAVLLT